MHCRDKRGVEAIPKVSGVAARRYVDTHATICVEDQNINGLKEKGYTTGLHRNIHDCIMGAILFLPHVLG